MMIALIVAATISSAPIFEPSTHSDIDPCQGRTRCTQATAAQLFALADQLFAQGDLAGAEKILIALAMDPIPQFRSEARFRLAALREKRGYLKGAIAALQDLLADEPAANRARLELSRLLAAVGMRTEARRELRRAQEAGLPPDVARTAGRFSRLLTDSKGRGAAVEITMGFDSNVNRSTSDALIDTIIAPFELDPDARRQSGLGINVTGQAHSRDKLGAKSHLLTRAGFRAEIFPDKSKFNDLQFHIGTGPEFSTTIGRVRPGVLVERRWFGGHPYSTGFGGVLNFAPKATSQSQLEIDASVIRQRVHTDRQLDGVRYTLAIIQDRTINSDMSLRLSARGTILDAEVRPQSLRQGSVEAILAGDVSSANLFGSVAYTKTRGRDMIALFGKTRDDHRIDIGGGLVLRRTIVGFAPIARILWTSSWSNIELYDYRRIRLDVGILREF